MITFIADIPPGYPCGDTLRPAINKLGSLIDGALWYRTLSSGVQLVLQSRNGPAVSVYVSPQLNPHDTLSLLACRLLRLVMLL